MQILAPELNDRLLADFLDMESSLIVSMHIQSVDQVKAIKTVKRKITDLDRSKIEEQKKAVRAGYDMDIIPSDLATYGAEAKKLLQDLQSRNERMFLVTFGAEHRGQSPSAGQQHLPGPLHRAQYHRPPAAGGLTGGGMRSSLPLRGETRGETQRGTPPPPPPSLSSRPPGLRSGKRSPVLRHQRPVQ